KDGIDTERYNLTHSEKRVPYLTQIMEGHDGPVVISTDYIRAYGEQIRRLIPNESVTILGTDGFGRSDTREALRRFFEIDRHYIALAALRGLKEDEKAEQFIEKYKIERDKSNPLFS
ncbi:MAG TPA: pyruvate dehydrogenase (acetyl-transferring), homodimeric type, partial [Spirochaetales bacterium]|nr:pyruvate dehydrogenase (acetyl-transferring), homodimeric type [Spirochaetales bacterium]